MWFQGFLKGKSVSHWNLSLFCLTLFLFFKATSSVLTLILFGWVWWWLMILTVFDGFDHGHRLISLWKKHAHTLKHIIPFLPGHKQIPELINAVFYPLKKADYFILLQIQVLNLPNSSRISNTCYPLWHTNAPNPSSQPSSKYIALAIIEPLMQEEVVIVMMQISKENSLLAVKSMIQHQTKPNWLK